MFENGYSVRNGWSLEIEEIILSKISLEGKLGPVVTITTY